MSDQVFEEGSMDSEVTGLAATVPSPRREQGETAAAVRAFGRVWALMAVAFRDGTHEQADGLVRATTGFAAAPFNGVWGVQPEVTVAAVLDAVDEFAAGELPWNLQLRPGYPAELDEHLERRGLDVTGEIPFMTLRDASGLDVGHPEVTFRRAVTLADVDSVLTLLAKGFGMPPEMIRDAFPIQLIVDRAASTWIAQVGDDDVSTALAFVVDDQCGIFDVATPPEWRGRGYGAAVTAHAVRTALADGALAAYLQSSPMGFQVYQRLCFGTVEEWRQWIPQEYAGHG